MSNKSNHDTFFKYYYYSEALSTVIKFIETVNEFGYSDIEKFSSPQNLLLACNMLRRRLKDNDSALEAGKVISDPFKINPDEFIFYKFHTLGTTNVSQLYR